MSGDYYEGRSYYGAEYTKKYANVEPIGHLQCFIPGKTKTLLATKMLRYKKVYEYLDERDGLVLIRFMSEGAKWYKAIRFDVKQYESEAAKIAASKRIVAEYKRKQRIKDATIQDRKEQRNNKLRLERAERRGLLEAQRVLKEEQDRLLAIQEEKKQAALRVTMGTLYHPERLRVANTIKKFQELKR